MLSALAPGVIDIYEEDAITERVFVINGFAEVTEERCTVLAEDVIPIDKLNPEELEETIVKIRMKVGSMDQADADRLNKLIVQKEAVLQAMRAVKT
jgi:F-type H+-transporting ATPase subunit epsilon